MGEKMPGFLYGADEVEAWERSKPPDCAQCGELRTRLESTEAARRDAQEGRLALIIENEELGAELAATRARLENAEVALREIRATSREYDGVASTAARYNRCLRIVDAALGAAGEKGEG